jgi:hypothetical protein
MPHIFCKRSVRWAPWSAVAYRRFVPESPAMRKAIRRQLSLPHSKGFAFNNDYAAFAGIYTQIAGIGRLEC